MAEPNDYILPSRKAKISFGFDDELLPLFAGASELPKVERGSRKVKIHFLDEGEKISNFHLSGGQLQLNVRTDRYIWSVLDAVYNDYFKVIASCDTTETWTDGSSETTNHRGGNGAIKVTSDSGALKRAYTNFSPALNLGSYSDDDYIDFFLYCEDASKVESLKIRLETTVDTNYFEYDLSSDVKSGWNEFHLLRSSFNKTGSGNWSSIVRFNVFFDATGSNTTYVIIDEVRITDHINYMRRYIDTGLQFIPVAWFAGNTALYEIKTACEAEGAKFYVDETGCLHFENRQFYNTHNEYKKSRWGFNFDRLTDLEFSGEENIINNVVVKIKPRKVVSAVEEIWNYAFKPSFNPSETKTIWASLQDPCPATTAGIITPEATTDYTANTKEDGSGTDKTSKISIVVTRFPEAVKLDITNTDAGVVYLTLLKLRGTPAKEADEIIVSYKDDDSIAIYGEKPVGGLIIENKYLADEYYASIRAEQIVDTYKLPMTSVSLKSRCVPQLQLGDMISVRNKDTGKDYLQRITNIKMSYSGNSLEQTIVSRPVSPQELLSYFTIGSSAIESTDVISP